MKTEEHKEYEKNNEEIVNISLKLSHFLRCLRKERNWTQEYLAEISTIDYKHIQRLESTKYNSDFRFSTVLKLSKAFDISLLDFIKNIIPNENYSDTADSEWGKVAESSESYKL